ncbi:MAG TPA: SURF1 family protein [Xanthomonadaceae bacterium]|nr:SURF1 family protein [Xanthomonadaceae bacterium]
MTRGQGLAGWLLAIVVAAAFVRLGVWQLDRVHEKQAMLDAAASAQARVLPLADALHDEQAYLQVRGSGRFLPAPPLLLDGRVRDGRVGVQVYQAFAPDGIERVLLIDMGWLPLPADRRVPHVSTPQGVQTVAGLLAPWPSAGLRLARASQPPSAGDALLMQIDRETTQRILRPTTPLHDGVLRLDPKLPLGYARDLQLLRNSLPPQRHLGYAVQWFALALAVLVTAGVLTWRIRSRR